jgi:hypothetical protein
MKDRLTLIDVCLASLYALSLMAEQAPDVSAEQRNTE